MNDLIDFVELLIEQSEKQSKTLRYCGIGVMLLTGTASCALLYVLLNSSENTFEISAVASMSITCLAALLILGYLSKLLLALSNAYSLRCGQMEDIKILLLSQNEDSIMLNDMVAALVSLRRGVLEEMVKTSIPENMLSELLPSLFSFSKGQKKKSETT